MQQIQYRGGEEEVRAMAEHVVPTSNEFSLAHIDTYFGLTKYEENNGSGNEFVFEIDRSLLIDPRGITYGREIGEGPHSIVYEGSWVSLSANSKTLLCFFFFFICIFMVISLCLYIRSLTLCAFSRSIMFCYDLGLISILGFCFMMNPL
jgi:hypothetical protein